MHFPENTIIDPVTKPNVHKVCTKTVPLPTHSPGVSTKGYNKVTKNTWASKIIIDFKSCKASTT